MDSNTIEEAAARWFARRESGHWSATDQIELDAWLAAATAHRIEYVRIVAAWQHAARMKALGAGIPPGVIPPRGSWGDVRFLPAGAPPTQTGSIAVDTEFALPGDSADEGGQSNGRPPRSRPLVDRAPDIDVIAPNSSRTAAVPAAPSLTKLPGRGGFRAGAFARTLRHFFVAAGLLLVFAGAVYTYTLRSSGHDGYSTKVGALSTVSLADGSQITLNTDSYIHIVLAPGERRIELDKGEAFFEVAHDPTRPFVVEIGKKRVIAVGTQFSVRRDSNDIRVAVTEGKVRIEDTSSPLRRKAGSTLGEGAQSEAAESTDVLLTAGGVAQTVNSEILVNEHAAPQVDQLLSWRKGYLVFRETPLADAVAEFNRYNTRRIVIDDPEIAAIRVGGNFRTNNADAFLWLIQHGFPIAVEAGDNKVILRHR